MDLAHHAIGCEPGFIRGRAIGGVCPDPTPGIRRLDQPLAQTGTVMLSRVSDDLAPNDTVLAVD